MKLVLDEVFGEHGFVNELVWRRISAHNDADKYGPIHDTISSTLRLAIMCGTHSSVRYPKNTWASSLIKSMRRMDAVMHGGT